MVTDPSLTINEFCEAEHISRVTLYRLWARGEGPRFFLVGNSRRISHEARQEWRRERETATAQRLAARDQAA